MFDMAARSFFAYWDFKHFPLQEQQSSVGGTGEEDDQNMNVTAMEEEEASVPENTEEAFMCTGASQETSLRSPCTTDKTEPSTPTFKFK